MNAFNTTVSEALKKAVFDLVHGSGWLSVITGNLGIAQEIKNDTVTLYVIVDDYSGYVQKAHKCSPEQYFGAKRKDWDFFKIQVSETEHSTNVPLSTDLARALFNSVCEDYAGTIMPYVAEFIPVWTAYDKRDGNRNSLMRLDGHWPQKPHSCVQHTPAYTISSCNNFVGLTILGAELLMLKYFKDRRLTVLVHKDDMTGVISTVVPVLDDDDAKGWIIVYSGYRCRDTARAFAQVIAGNLAAIIAHTQHRTIVARDDVVGVDVGFETLSVDGATVSKSEVDY
jgi:hypothetical protein